MAWYQRKRNHDVVWGVGCVCVCVCEYGIGHELLIQSHVGVLSCVITSEHSIGICHLSAVGANVGEGEVGNA